MDTTLRQLVKTVLDANDNVYPDQVGYDIATGVCFWVAENTRSQEPVIDLIVVSEGWDVEEFEEGFLHAKEGILAFIQELTKNSENVGEVPVSSTDTMTVVVKRILKLHGATYDIVGNEISKMVLGYLTGYLTFYKDNENCCETHSESFVAGIETATSNVIQICRAYIY